MPFLIPCNILCTIKLDQTLLSTWNIQKLHLVWILGWITKSNVATSKEAANLGDTDLRRKITTSNTQTGIEAEIFGRLRRPFT
jgi:hypothetical protein